MNDIFQSEEFQQLEKLCHAKKVSFILGLTKFSSWLMLVRQDTIAVHISATQSVIDNVTYWAICGQLKTSFLQSRIWCACGKSHGHGQSKMGMPVTVAMGNAYYVFFMPMVIATRMRMPSVMGMPMTMCTGTYTIGKHASWMCYSFWKFLSNSHFSFPSFPCFGGFQHRAPDVACLKH